MNKFPWTKNYPKGIEWKLETPQKPLYHILERASTKYPSNNALNFMGKKYTYAQLKELTDRAAAGFQKLGVKKGDRVGLFLPNCPQYVIAYFGILKVGGIVVNFSPLYAVDELAYQAEDSGTEIMVTLNITALYPKIEELLKMGKIKKVVVGKMTEVLPFPKSVLYPIINFKDISKIPRNEKHVWFSDILKNDGNYQSVKIDPHKDIAVLQYTGGTTGVPKGAMLTHENLYANALQATKWFVGTEPGKERCLGVLPFFHVFAMTVVMNMTIYLASEIIMHPRFELEAVIKAIERDKPTMMPGVPTMFQAINTYKGIENFDLSSLSTCVSGGAPLPKKVKEEFERLSGCKLVEGYGLTEASPICTCNPLEGDNKALSIGLPLPGTKIKIVDKEDPAREMPIGKEGEILVKGPQVMAGYWKNKAETDNVMAGDYLRTGDIGYMDEDGYIFIIDRMKDLILCGGYNVYPRHVEDAIYLHSAVEACTVVGIPDEYRGQTVKAFVSLKDGQELTAQELKAFLKDKLGKHELPTHIEFRDELPKTMVGKLSKKELLKEELDKLRKVENKTK